MILEPSSSPERLSSDVMSPRQLNIHAFCRIAEGIFLQAMVVLMRPTFVKRAILANSIPKAGVSAMRSFNTLEHLLELYTVLIYRSPNVTLSRLLENGSVKTARLSVNK